MESLLELDTSTQGMTMRNSTILHPGTGLYLCASRPIGRGELFGYFLDYLQNENMTEERQKTEAYGYNVMQVTPEACQKCVNKERDEV